MTPIETISYTDRGVNGTKIYYTNILIENMIFATRALNVELGPYSDLYVKNFTFRNTYSPEFLFLWIRGARDVYLEDFLISNVTTELRELCYSWFTTLTVKNFTITDIKSKSYKIHA